MKAGPRELLMGLSARILAAESPEARTDAVADAFDAIQRLPVDLGAPIEVALGMTDTGMLNRNPVAEDPDAVAAWLHSASEWIAANGEK